VSLNDKSHFTVEGLLQNTLGKYQGRNESSNSPPTWVWYPLWKDGSHYGLSGPQDVPCDCKTSRTAPPAMTRITQWGCSNCSQPTFLRNRLPFLHWLARATFPSSVLPSCHKGVDQDTQKAATGSELGSLFLTGSITRRPGETFNSCLQSHLVFVWRKLLLWRTVSNICKSYCQTFNQWISVKCISYSQASLHYTHQPCINHFSLQ